MQSHNYYRKIEIPVRQTLTMTLQYGIIFDILTRQTFSDDFLFPQDWLLCLALGKFMQSDFFL